MSDSERGLYRKYKVERTDGSSASGGKHADCRYFVLDLEHDEFSIPALQAYATAAELKFPNLARDLFEIVGRDSLQSALVASQQETERLRALLGEAIQLARHAIGCIDTRHDDGLASNAFHADKRATEIAKEGGVEP